MSTPYDLARDLQQELESLRRTVLVQCVFGESEFLGFDTDAFNDVERAFKKALNDEIEACARILDAAGDFPQFTNLARAIRARRRP